MWLPWRHAVETVLVKDTNDLLKGWPCVLVQNGAIFCASWVFVTRAPFHSQNCPGFNGSSESPWLLTTNSTEQLSIFIVLDLIYLFLHHTVDHLIYCDLQLLFDLCWLSLLVLLVSSQSFLRLCLPFKWWHCPDFCYWFLLFALHTFSLDKLIHRNRCS